MKRNHSKTKMSQHDYNSHDNKFVASSKFLCEYRRQVRVLAANPESGTFWKWMDRVRSTEGWV